MSCAPLTVRTPVPLTLVPWPLAEDGKLHAPVCNLQYTGRWADGSKFVTLARCGSRFLGSSPRVCQDGWDDRDAAVVCNQLGYAYGTAVRGAAGGGSTPPGPQRMRIWLDEVACSGREQRLSMCATGRPLGQSDCSHRADAGVQCWDDEPEEPGVVPLRGAECECGDLGFWCEAWSWVQKGDWGRGARMFGVWDNLNSKCIGFRRPSACLAGFIAPVLRSVTGV